MAISGLMAEETIMKSNLLKYKDIIFPWVHW